MDLLGSFLVAVGGIGMMLAMGAWEIWRRQHGRLVAPVSEYPDSGVRSTGGMTGDVEVGHLGFDQQFHVQGPMSMVRARFDGPTRDAMLALLQRLREGELKVADGELRVLVPPGQRASRGGPERDGRGRFGRGRARRSRRGVTGPADGCGHRTRDVATRTDHLECAPAAGRGARLRGRARPHGDPQDEPLLLAIVVEERDDALRLAAVRALAQVGSAQAVPALTELAGSRSPDLRRAGREAIATIQSRLHGATPGQLSLDGSGAGQVALADDAAGRLSETAKDDA